MPSVFSQPGVEDLREHLCPKPEFENKSSCGTVSAKPRAQKPNRSLISSLFQQMIAALKVHKTDLYLADCTIKEKHDLRL